MRPDHRHDTPRARRTGRLLEDYHQAGSLPGSLPQQALEGGATRVAVLDYRGQRLDAREVRDIEALSQQRDSDSVTWVQISGLNDLALIKRIGDLFNLHPLAIEDAVHKGQRPKYEDYRDHGFAIFQFPVYEGEHIALRQVSIFFGAHFVVTFQPAGEDVLAPVRTRIEQAQGRIREQGVDYLVYTIMDLIVDNAFPVLEQFGDRLETLEDTVAAKPGHRHNIEHIHSLRNDLLHLRRAFWPQRDIFAQLLRDGEGRFSEETRVYLRDLYDHGVQILDVVESYRDMVASLSDLYLSGLSLRLNDVMRTLTLISTIFMPLTFIAGVYGMNFDRSSPFNMPELGWRYGYPVALAVMVVVAIAMLIFFKRKRWL